MNLWRCWENWASQHTANDRRVTFIGLTSGRPIGSAGGDRNSINWLASPFLLGEHTNKL